MRFKLKWFIPAALVIIVIAVYLIPPARSTFDELAENVPDRQRLQFQAFKNQFAPHRLIGNGTSWEYITLGPEREAVLFLHGMTGAYDIWWQQIFDLRLDYKLVSVTYPAVDSLEELSQGIIAILDAEGISAVNIVGTSLGGYLAQYLIATHPERILRVVLGNTFPPNDILRQENGLLGTALPFLPEWTIMRTLQGSITDSIYPASGQDDFTRAYLLSLTSGGISKAQVVARYRTVIESFAPADPFVLGIPVLIIESDNDPLVNETLRSQLRQTYPYAQAFRLTNAGHFPYLNQWQEYNQLLQRFLLEPSIE